MEITVIDDRVELNGFTLARLVGDAPPTLAWEFERFFHGREEDHVRDDALIRGEELAYNDGYSAGYDKGADEVKEIGSELAKLRAAVTEICDAIDGGSKRSLKSLSDKLRKLCS